jgi:hypothetical protein
MKKHAQVWNYGANGGNNLFHILNKRKSLYNKEWPIGGTKFVPTVNATANTQDLNAQETMKNLSRHNDLY